MAVFVGWSNIRDFCKSRQVIDRPEEMTGLGWLFLLDGLISETSVSLDKS